MVLNMNGRHGKEFDRMYSDIYGEKDLEFFKALRGILSSYSFFNELSPSSASEVPLIFKEVTRDARKEYIKMVKDGEDKKKAFNETTVEISELVDIIEKQDTSSFEETEFFSHLCSHYNISNN